MAMCDRVMRIFTNLDVGTIPSQEVSTIQEVNQPLPVGVFFTTPYSFTY